MSGRGGSGGGRGGEYYRQKYGGGGGGGGGGGRGGGGRGGEYYRQKYGGGGRGGGRGAGGGGGWQHDAPSGGGEDHNLAAFLQQIDGSQYPVYKQLSSRGPWTVALPGAAAAAAIAFDYIQGDPFAPPSRLRARVPMSFVKLPTLLYSSAARMTAACDFLTRRFADGIARRGADQAMEGSGWSGPKGGDVTVDRPGQEVLNRTSCFIDDSTVELRFSAALPARGRTILGRAASELLTRHVPAAVAEALTLDSAALASMQRHVEVVEDARAIRAWLSQSGFVSFVADGSILPRESGASDRPLDARVAVPFKSPESLAVEVQTPNSGVVRGMGIRAGVTVIVGGGFHGKSTLLAALERGVYEHIPGDGREFVVCVENAAKVRAEDGRNVSGVDISSYITNLPMNKDTSHFTSSDASGSTSQAAAIVESVEAGSRCLLMDEDTCATNFMIRDAAMAALISADREPITPFVARVRGLLENLGVSTVLVIGGCGDYFHRADTVVRMDEYQAYDVTAEARAIASRMPPPPDAASAHKPPRMRVLSGVLPSGFDDPKVSIRVTDRASIGDSVELELGGLSQLVSISQTRTIVDAIVYCHRDMLRGGKGKSLTQVLDDVEALWDRDGLDATSLHAKSGNRARPRRIELAGALNRLRSSSYV